MKRKALGTALAVMMGLSFCACGFGEERVQEEGDQEEALMEQAEEEPFEDPKWERPPGGRIGLFMAQKTGKQSVDARILKEELEEEGYGTVLYFARDTAEQGRQLKEAFKEGLRGILLSPAGEESLNEALKDAAAQGIPVVSYGRLAMDTEYLDAYVTYDYQEAGRRWGELLLKGWKAAQEQQEGEPRDYQEGESIWMQSLEVLEAHGEEVNALVAFQGLLEEVGPALSEGWLVYENHRLGLKRTAAFLEDEPLAFPWERLLDGCERCRDEEALAREGARVIDLCARNRDVTEDAALVYDNGTKIVPAHLVSLMDMKEEALLELLEEWQYQEEERKGTAKKEQPGIENE